MLWVPWPESPQRASKLAETERDTCIAVVMTCIVVVTGREVSRLFLHSSS